MSPEKSPTGRGHLRMLALWGIPIILMVAAWLVYTTGIGIPLGTSNRGLLVQPAIAIDDLLPPPGQRPQWTLLIRGDSECNVRCRENLYLTRQAHIALNRNGWKVRRVYLYEGKDAPAELTDFLAREHPQMALHSIVPNILARRLEKAEEPPGFSSLDAFYLVDPEGFLMMAYDEQHGGGDLLKDLKFLLRIGGAL